MDAFWEYFSVLAPSVGLALIFWLVMRSLFRVDAAEREARRARQTGRDARAAQEEQEAREWAARRGDPDA